jgi:preprotein translocase subunit SecG
MEILISLAMIAMAIVMILLVLVQRGKGGGLAGALGGSGGQSALGSRAGDKMTRITMYVAGTWMLLCIVAIWSLKSASTEIEELDYDVDAPVAESNDADADESAPADE